MCTAYIIFFKKKSEEEVAPVFFKDKDGEMSADKMTVCCFMSLPSIREKTWAGLKGDIQSNHNIVFSSFVVFAHDLSQYPGILHDLLKETLTHVYIDYSGGDPSYKPMWEQIRNSKDITELVKTLEYWKRSYIIDPLRRIKHRAINLFLPLSTDIQFLLEIWRRKDFAKAKTHLEELKAEWSDDKSPVSILYRLWYMLVGKHLNWAEGDLPEKPTDVSLPMGKNPDRKEEPYSLYDWLTKYFGEQVQKFDEWQKLLKDTQLCQVKNDNDKDEVKFNVVGGYGVYRFSKMITEMIKCPGNIKPDEKVYGFGINQNLEHEFNAFLDWLNTLNDSLESLITQCQKKS